MDAERLSAIPFFAGLSDATRGVLAGAAQETTVDVGATVVQEGDFGYAMFAIENGTADVVYNGSVVAALGRGDVFGEIAALTSGRRTASVVATSPLTLITLLNRDCWRLEREAPEAVTELREQVGRRLAALEAAGRSTAG